MPATCVGTSYSTWGNCVRLSDEKIEMIITLDVGPRIIRFAYINGQNILKEFPDLLATNPQDQWVNYGGHRLWHAPEIFPRTYEPDNSPVEYQWDGSVLTINQKKEPNSNIQKSLKISINSDSVVTIEHSLTNKNLWEIETAAWALTVLEAGGRAIIPQEPFIPFPDALLPARPLVLWQYTNMADPRFLWEKEFIQITQSAEATCPQKIGIGNTQNWGLYEKGGIVFLKRSEHVAKALYPDYGCNWEVYTDADMLELETLSPLQKLPPNATITHTETWELQTVEANLPAREVLKQLNLLG